jgi:hypothetical protein
MTVICKDYLRGGQRLLRMTNHAWLVFSLDVLSRR